MKNSKALFITNQGLAPIGLGIQLEVIEEQIAKGYEIILATCNKSTDSCFFNPTGNPIACGICRGRNAIFLKMLSIPARVNTIFPNINVEHILNLFDPMQSSLIDSWEYNGIPFGKGVLSSVISNTRDYDIQQSSMIPYIKEETRVALKALLGFSKLIDDFNPQKVFIFNGRFSETYPMVSYCWHHKIQFETMEGGGSDQLYETYENSLPHSIQIRKEKMYSRWHSGAENKHEIATQWYFNKVKGTNLDDKNYTINQINNLLPSTFDESNINIAIFNSSEDEMKTIDEWQNSIYDFQNEAIHKICRYFENDHNLVFYLRVHPNLANLKNTQVKEIEGMNYKNLHIIRANDPIHSYSLLNKCNIVLSFGSTIGIEATFHGKVSILLGKSFYSGIDAVFEPKSYDELFYLIKHNKTLSPKPIENTLPYAYSILNMGQSYKYLKYQGKYNSYFKGVHMKRFYPITIFYIALYALSLPKWVRKFKILYGRIPGIYDLRELKIK